MVSILKVEVFSPKNLTLFLGKFIVNYKNERKG